MSVCSLTESDFSNHGIGRVRRFRGSALVDSLNPEHVFAALGQTVNSAVHETVFHPNLVNSQRLSFGPAAHVLFLQASRFQFNEQ